MQLNATGEKMSYENILTNMERVNDYFVYTNVKLWNHKFF